MNKAVVNEDANARIIRELREEIERLRGTSRPVLLPDRTWAPLEG